MTLTIMAAAKEVAALNDPSMEQLAKAISSGSFKRRQRKLRRYPFPAFKRIYKRNQNR